VTPWAVKPPTEIEVRADPYSLNAADPYEVIAALRAAAQLYRSRRLGILNEGESGELARLWGDLSHIVSRAANAAEKACATKSDRSINL